MLDPETGEYIRKAEEEEKNDKKQKDSEKDSKIDSEKDFWQEIEPKINKQGILFDFSETNPNRIEEEFRDEIQSNHDKTRQSPIKKQTEQEKKARLQNQKLTKPENTEIKVKSKGQTIDIKDYKKKIEAIKWEHEQQIETQQKMQKYFAV